MGRVPYRRRSIRKMTEDERLVLVVIRNQLSRSVVSSTTRQDLLTLRERKSQCFDATRHIGISLAVDLMDTQPERAARCLDVIHNLPFSPDELATWDAAHFLRCELVSFLELAPESDALTVLTGVGADILELRTNRLI